MAGGESVIEHAIVSVVLAARCNDALDAWCLLIDIFLNIATPETLRPIWLGVGMGGKRRFGACAKLRVG